MKSLKFGLAAGLAALTLSAVPIAGKATIIPLNGSLTNASFEDAPFTGCPTGWTCSGPIAWFVSTPTITEYPDPNGLLTGTYVPDGTHAAQTPTTSTSSGSIGQLIAQQYAINNQYVLDFWLGNPLGGAFPGTVTIALTVGTLTQQSNLCDSGFGGRNATLTNGVVTVTDSSGGCQLSIGGTGNVPAPLDGTWTHYTLAYNSGTSTSNFHLGNIGIVFNVISGGSGQNGWALNLDVAGAQTPPTTGVPEPATLGLLAAGLMGIGLYARRSRRR